MNLSVTFLDALIVLIIIVSAGYAAWRGFLWETLTIFAWVAAAFGCLYFGPYVIPLVRGMVKEDWLATLIAYAAVFLAVFIPFAFMSHRFSESVKHSPIGPLDRAAGVAFGVVRGLVIIGLAYLAFTYFVAIRSQPSWLTQARLLPMVQSTAEVLLSMVPNHPGDYAFAHHDNGPEPEIQQETSAQPPERHDPMADLIRQGKAPAQPARPNSMADLIRGKTPAAAPAARKSDSMADLIAHDGDAASVKTAREPVPQKSSSHAAKSAGTTDRQQLDKLIETGGNGNR